MSNVQNTVLLIGRLTKEVESKATTNSTVATFTLAVDRNFTNQEGKREADFIPIVCWKGLADNASKFLHKGSLVAVSGAIQVRKYQAQDGTNRYATEVVADGLKFLDKKDGNNQPHNDTPQNNNDTGFAPVNDDDIPF
jgi:single-strand DNA-binding protein